MNQTIEIAKKIGFGSWNWNTTKDILDWDENMFSLFDLERGPVNSSFFFESIVEEDRERVRKSVEKSLMSGHNFSEKFKIITGKGNSKNVRAFGTVENINGDRVMSGINIPISDIDYLNSAQKPVEIQKFETSKKILFTLKKIFSRSNDNYFTKETTENFLDGISIGTKKMLSDEGTDYLSIELVYNAGVTYPYHFHEYDENFTLISGDVTITVEGKKVSLLPLESVLIKKGTYHKLETKDGFKAIVTWQTKENFINYQK